MQDTPIRSAFERLRRDRAHRAAVAALSEGRSFTFGQIGVAADELARALARLPLEAGRPVALLVGNHSSFLPLLLACLDRRLVVLPLDGDSPLSEALRVARRYEAQALIVIEGTPGTGEPGAWTPLPCGLRLQRLPGGATIDFHRAALLKLTSGSTELPRAVLCSEEHLWRDGLQVMAAMGIDGESVQLGAIPLAHSYALGNLVVPLLVGGARLVLRHGFIPPAFCRDVAACGVTVFPGVPFMFDHIAGPMALEHLPRPLRTLISAGAPLEPRTVRLFKERYGAKIHSFYGSSETGGIAYDASEDVSEPLTVGTALPDVSITLEAVELPPVPGAGQVLVASPAVAAGYAGEPGPSSNGRFLTADIGRLDEGGRLFLLGRVSRSINVAGRKVQPEEVERVLLELPEVAEAKVLGVPDPVRGERLVACLVPAGGAIKALEVRRHCARCLAPYKIPRAILVLERMPMTPRGKVDRRALEELARTRG